MSDLDSIRYHIETLFFGLASRTMELGGGIESVENAEAEAQQFTDNLYRLLDEHGYEIVVKVP